MFHLLMSCQRDLGGTTTSSNEFVTESLTRWPSSQTNAMAAPDRRALTTVPTSAWNDRRLSAVSTTMTNFLEIQVIHDVTPSTDSNTVLPSRRHRPGDRIRCPDHPHRRPRCLNQPGTRPAAGAAVGVRCLCLLAWRAGWTCLATRKVESDRTIP
jgi:hypothetical protein